MCRKKFGKKKCLGIFSPKNIFGRPNNSPLHENKQIFSEGGVNYSANSGNSIFLLFQINYVTMIWQVYISANPKFSLVIWSIYLRKINALSDFFKTKHIPPFFEVVWAKFRSWCLFRILSFEAFQLHFVGFFIWKVPLQKNYFKATKKSMKMGHSAE